MFRPLKYSHRTPHRRGTSFILIVVVMLSLFSAVGTAYALFAIREAKLAQQRKNEMGAGSSTQLKAPEPTDTINQFFSALIYDGSNDGRALVNGMRGHSIGRSMYGYDALNPNNTTPWNGVGTFHELLSSNGYTVQLTDPANDRANCVNYTVMMIGGKPFLLDPEYMGVRPLDMSGNLSTFAAAGRTFIPKNAGYSYPDLKDFFMGYRDAATGEVFVPSFHRPWLFGSLDASNQNWTNDTGRLLTLRPRPQEHPNFPRVPPNQVPAGQPASYTGDVKNLTGAPGGNDSIWINLGLPVITLPGNRKVQPLVAALVLPLNGCLDVNSHGNLLLGGTHKSNHGIGPWEVGLNWALPADATKVINGRNPQYPLNPATAVWQPQQRVYATGSAPMLQPSRSFDPFSPFNPVAAPFPNYAPVYWDGSAVVAPAYPTGLTGVPAFAATTNTAVLHHPSLHNPSEWSSTSMLTSRTYPVSDIKRLHLRYASTPDWIEQAALADPNIAGTVSSLKASGFNLITAQTTSNAYRTDLAHTRPGLFTTRSYDLARPKLVPMYLNRDTTPLATTAGQLKPTNVSPGAYPVPGTPRGTAITDFTAVDRWSNLLASLGAIDLNRPLTDYRRDLNQPLGLTNLDTNPVSATFPQLIRADFDRRKLAHDIFVRLAAATGAGLTINLTPTEYPQYQYSIPNTVSSNPQQFNALRYLAQLAVNMVDYLDNDDVSTVFVWNPSTAGNDPNADANNFSATELPNRVVFGVEKPRLVLNEAYGEIVNHPQEKEMEFNGLTPVEPKFNAHVRFWLELVNPTNDPYPTGVNGPLGTGAATLWNGTFSPYQIEIARVNRKNIVDPAMNAGQVGATWNAQTDGPDNPTGGLVAGMLPDIQFQFSATSTITEVRPNNGQFNPPAPQPNNGMVLLGTKPSQEVKKDEFVPTWPNNSVITSADPVDTQATQQNSLAYSMPLPTTTAELSSAEYRRHIVLLRRLANPYQQPSQTNPYITTDSMDGVAAFDAVAREKSATRGNSRGVRNSNDGYDPPTERFSIGKVQPYAGQVALAMNFPSSDVGGYNQYQAFPISMVQRQAPTTTVPMQPQNTFGRHNSKSDTVPASLFAPGTPATLNETLLTPFDWLVHLDRPLVNQLELLQVRDTPPHRVTQQFIVSSTNSPGISYDAGYVPWVEGGFSRAFEYLTVRSRIWGVGHGGRVPGLINVNAMTDQRVLNALIDTQGGAGNTFDQTNFGNGLWSQTGWIGSRGTMQAKPWPNGASVQTPVPNSMPNPAFPPTLPQYLPTSSKTDAPTSTTSVDNPFFSFGAPFVTADGNAIAYGAGSNVDPNTDRTILRRTTVTGNPVPQPYLFTNQLTKRTDVNLNYPTTQPDGPSYYRAEPARKMLNNITTVNHQYIVFLTIGYFDVVGQVTLAPGVSPIPQLGAEAFISVPGDMRQKVVAVVDMSNMALRADSLINPGDPIATEMPFFTSLEATAYGNGTTTATLSIAYSRFVQGATPAQNQLGVTTTDGQEVAVGGYLVLGYGAEEQVVQVTGIPGPGQVSVQTVGGVPFRTAWAGTSVSNVRPGFPGPQPTFNYTDPKYKGVLPYVERLR